MTINLPLSTALCIVGAFLAMNFRYNTTAKYETICIKLMRATKVKMLIIDELHNLLAGNNNVQREFLNLF